MPFATGTNIATRNAFLSGLCAFAAANAGFTDHGAVIANHYVCSKDGIYHTFTTNQETSGTVQYYIVAKMMNTLLSSSGQFTSSALGSLYPCAMGCFGEDGPYPNYWYYTDGNYVAGVLEIFAGVYSHIVFGRFTALDTWSGGQFMTASILHFKSGGNYASSGLRLFTGSESSTVYTNFYGYVYNSVATGNSNDFARMSLGPTGTPQQASRPFAMGPISGSTSETADQYNGIGEAGAPVMRGATPLLPIGCPIYSPTTGLYNLMGKLSNIAYINMGAIPPASLVVAPSGNWRVFPICSLRINPTVHSTTAPHLGIAYREYT